MDELIKKYYSLTTAYLIKLIEYMEMKPRVVIPASSTFKTLEDYLRFRKESLNELIKLLQNFSKELGKYGKYKTLDPKIVNMAEMNALTNGKFYDYAISHFNYREIEPDLYKLIDNHFSEFYKLSRKISETKQGLKNQSTITNKNED